MTLLLDIAPYSPPVSRDVTGAEIYQRFESEPDTLAIAVVDASGCPVGLIERNAFLVRMAAHYGRALWSRRPVSSWMNADPLIADGDMTVEEFCGRVLQDRPSELLHGFIVTCGGRYAGVGAMLALLQATASAALEANRQAQRALEARGRFLATMSHEIRTPLNGVLTVAEIIRRKATQPELAPLLDTIVESGGMLLRLLNDSLDLSRAEASELALDEQPVEPAQVLEDIRALWAPAAELKGVEIDFAYEGAPDIWVLADAIRLRQILNNLLSNALKFTLCGRVRVRLAAHAESDQCVRLRGVVADSGPGVPADQREHIFAPFQQTDEGLRLGGAGLGLAVCQQLVERMGGTIGVDDNPGGGAVFAFELPLFSVPSPQAAPTATGAAPAAGVGAHVLIADDNATNRVVAQTLCEMFGCSSECVEDGAQAVRAAAEGRFDLILMDIKMPVMGGVEAAQRIRSGSGPASRIPILALTANADPADAAIYRRCGMNGVVQKPIKPEELLAGIQEVLSLEHADAELVLAAEPAALRTASTIWSCTWGSR